MNDRDYASTLTGEINGQVDKETRRAMRRRERGMVYLIRGPITLITVGVLFAFNNFTQYGFDRTWPVILIVFGLLTLVGRGTSSPPPADGGQNPAPPSGETV